MFPFWFYFFVSRQMHKKHGCCRYGMILENINGKQILEFPNRSQAFNDQ
jgi:hypothetical protein